MADDRRSRSTRRVPTKENPRHVDSPRSPRPHAKHKYRRVARFLQQLVATELPNSWSREARTDGLRHLIIKAQHLELVPDDASTPVGRDAFTAIARVIFGAPSVLPNLTLRAEWALVLSLAKEPPLSMYEQWILDPDLDRDLDVSQKDPP